MELHQHRSVVHLDSDCTQHPSAVPRESGSSSLWSPVVLGKLGFLCFKRSRAASVRPHLEPHSTWHQLGGAGASFRVAPHLASCSGSSSPRGAPDWEARLCLHSSRVPCHQTTSSATGTLQWQSGQSHSRALQAACSRLLPSAMPAPCPTASKHLGAIRQNAGFQGWVGFCV